MILMVLITSGTEADKTKAAGYFKQSPGWQLVMPDVWLMAVRSGATPQAWQDFLAKHVPNLQFLVVRLANSWGASATQGSAPWLRSAGGWF